MESKDRFLKILIVINIVLLVLFIAVIAYTVATNYKISEKLDSLNQEESAHQVYLQEETTVREAVWVSVVQLISNPEKYHGKKVIVEGIAQIEFEGNVLFLDMDSYDQSFSKNGIWLAFDEDFYNNNLETINATDGKAIIIEGVFDAQKEGHFDMFSGSLKNITRYEDIIID